MVSPIDSLGERRAIRLALKELGLQFEKNARTSVALLSDELGYAVTVVHLAGSIQVYILHVRPTGEVSPFGSGQV